MNDREIRAVREAIRWADESGPVPIETTETEDQAINESMVFAFMKGFQYAKDNPESPS